MASITSVISIFVLVLAAYCNALPVLTTEKSMMKHFTTEMPELTTFVHMADHKHVGVEHESESDEHTSESPIKREFDNVSFPTSTFDATTEKMHKGREMGEIEHESEEHTTERFMTTDDASFPTSTFEQEKDMKFTTGLPHVAIREFESDSLATTFESSTEFNERALRESSGWFERRSYSEPEVEEEHVKVLPIKHFDMTKTLEPSSSVDSFGKYTGLIHDEIKPILTEVKVIHPMEDKYTHVEKIIPGTFHEDKLLHEDNYETKLLHKDMPHKEFLVNDYGTKLIHDEIIPSKKVLVNDYETKLVRDEIIPSKKVLVNDYETKLIHDEIIPSKKFLVKDYETKLVHDEIIPSKKFLVKDYETVKPALEEVKVKTILTEKKSSY